MKIYKETLIDASVDKTYSLFCDFENSPKYIKDIDHVELLTEGPLRVGSVYRETRKSFGKTSSEEMEIVDLQENKFCKLVTENQGARFETYITFSEDANKTKVEIEVKCKPISLRARLSTPMALFSKANIKRYMSNDLQELKKVLEEDSST